MSLVLFILGCLCWMAAFPLGMIPACATFVGGCVFFSGAVIASKLEDLMPPRDVKTPGAHAPTLEPPPLKNDHL